MAIDSIETWYRSTLVSADTTSQLSQHESSQICIVGAGMAGLSAAASLVEKGYRDIVVLEQGPIGNGASGRNGGFVFGGYSLSEHALLAQCGAEHARQLYQMTKDAVARVRRRVQDYEIDCQLSDNGVLLANWFKDEKLLPKHQSLLRDVYDTEWSAIEADKMARMTDTDFYHDGLLESNAFHLHSLNYLCGLAAWLQEQGVRIYTQTPVSSIEQEGDAWKVNTEFSSVSAAKVLVCGGAYMGHMKPRKLPSSILPIATYIMVTEPVKDLLPRLFEKNWAVYDSRFAFDYYRPLHDGRLLWGGRIAIYDRSPESVRKVLRKDMLKVYPQLADSKTEFAWSGWMGYSRHKMLQLGELKPGLWHLQGFGGHGMAPTTAAGEVVASAIAGDDSGLRYFKPWGLVHGGSFAGLLAAQVTYWALQTGDWLKEISSR